MVTLGVWVLLCGGSHAGHWVMQRIRWMRCSHFLQGTPGTVYGNTVVSAVCNERKVVQGSSTALFLLAL